MRKVIKAEERFEGTRIFCFYPLFEAIIETHIIIIGDSNHSQLILFPKFGKIMCLYNYRTLGGKNDGDRYF